MSSLWPNLSPLLSDSSMTPPTQLRPPLTSSSPTLRDKLRTQMFRKGTTHKLKPSPSDITANGLSNSVVGPLDHCVTYDQYDKAYASMQKHDWKSWTGCRRRVLCIRRQNGNSRETYWKNTFIVRFILSLFNIRLRDSICILNEFFVICEVYACVTKHSARVHLCGMWLSMAIDVHLWWAPIR